MPYRGRKRAYLLLVSRKYALSRFLQLTAARKVVILKQSLCEEQMKIQNSLSQKSITRNNEQIFDEKIFHESPYLQQLWTDFNTKPF